MAINITNFFSLAVVSDDNNFDREAMLKRAAEMVNDWCDANQPAVTLIAPVVKEYFFKSAGKAVKLADLVKHVNERCLGGSDAERAQAIHAILHGGGYKGIKGRNGGYVLAGPEKGPLRLADDTNATESTDQ